MPPTMNYPHMNWELYEVWSVDEDGHEELVDTTKSLKEARQIAQANITDYYVEGVVYQEDPNGDLVEVERVK